MDFFRATELTPEVFQQINHAFSYQPWNEEQQERGKKVREALASAVAVIVQHVPPSPTRTVAIRKIFEARMDCNAAISFNGEM